MLFFGSFEVNNSTHSWTLATLPCFILIGALGGFFGGAFNYFNSKLLPLRKKYIHVAVWRRVAEIAVAVTATTVLLWLVVRNVHKCEPVPPPPHDYAFRQFGCPDVRRRPRGRDAISLSACRASTTTWRRSSTTRRRRCAPSSRSDAVLSGRALTRRSRR